MRTSWRLDHEEYFGARFEPPPEAIHVLVQAPQVAQVAEAPKTTLSAQELSEVDLEMDSKIWQSVVRISCADACVGSALVLDRSSTHVYLLTNLQLWMDELYVDHLSDEFKGQIEQYMEIHSKITPGKMRDTTRASPKPEPRKSQQQIVAKKSPTNQKKPKIVIRSVDAVAQTMQHVHTFRLDNTVCWSSSADWDFAIFEVAVPKAVPLTPCRIARGVRASMRVLVFGFPAAQDREVGHQYAITPAQITGLEWGRMTLSTLSAAGHFDSAIICTRTGIPVGYVGGGFGSSSRNKQFQSHGFTFAGIPWDLPSRLRTTTRANSASSGKNA